MFGGPFDGSHVRRREVNLGGRTNAKSKQSTLQLAKEQRERRRLHALRSNSAKCLQQHLRGFNTRKHVAFQLASHQQQFLTSKSRGHPAEQRKMSLLAFRLSTPLLPFWPEEPATANSTMFSKPRGKVASKGISSMIDMASKYTRSRRDLYAFAAYFIEAHNIVNCSSDRDLLNQRQFVTHRLLRAALFVLCHLADKRNGDERISVEDSRGCLALAKFVFQCCNDETASFFNAPKIATASFNEKYVLLLLCVHCWLSKTASVQNGMSPMVQETCETLFKAVTHTLNQTITNNYSLRNQGDLMCAPFAIVLFSVPQLWQHPLFSYMNGMLTQARHMFSWSTLTRGLSRAVLLPGKANVQNLVKESQQLPLQLTIRKLLDTLVKNARCETTVLVNVIHIALLDNSMGTQQSIGTSSSSVATAVRMIHFTFKQRPDVSLLSSMAVVSDSTVEDILNKYCNATLAFNKKSAPNAEESDDLMRSSIDVESLSSDDENDLEGLEISAAKRPLDSRQESSRSMPTRAEFSTTKSMDDSFKRYIARQRATICQRKCSEEEIENLHFLVYYLGKDDVMLRLGMSIFGKITIRDGASQGQDAPEEECQIEMLYCQILFQVFSDASGFRPNSSRLCSQLAFCPNRTIAKGIWRHTVFTNDFTRISNNHAGALAASSVFCDIMTHTLMAVDDDDFLVSFTGRIDDENNAASMPGSAQLVRALNHQLYKLYWTRPVLANFLTATASATTTSTAVNYGSEEIGRFRLLLSGTKLFNSLYERWSRLQSMQRAIFCDENDFLWSKLLSSPSGAVERGTAGLISSSGVGRFDGSNAIVGSLDQASDMQLDADNSSYDEDDVMAEDGQHQRPSSGEEYDDDTTLASSFRDPKLARVLTACPQVLPFVQRVKMFTSLLEADKANSQSEESDLRALMMTGGMPDRIQVKVRRDELYQDSLQHLNPLRKKMRQRIQVTLINKHGTEESGIDGGGVFKEYLDDLIKDAFEPRDGGLFGASPVETLFVNPSPSTKLERNAFCLGINMLAQYEFLGRVLGKAVYESVLVDPQFSLPFLNLVLGKRNTLNDLETFDPEFYRHLTSLRNMVDVGSLGLSFEVMSAFDQRGRFVSDDFTATSVPLLPSGGSMAVAKNNVTQYVHLLSNHKLNVEGSIQARAFLRGFRDLIPAPWLRLFSAPELQKLISGDDAVKGIDVTNLKQHIAYAGGYHPSQPIIQWFWDVINEFTPLQQRKFLKFMTSCSRQPLLGFQALVPLPCIQQIHMNEQEGKLPTSSTCMNLLKLPCYTSKKILQEKLLYAVEAGAGFELT